MSDLKVTPTEAPAQGETAQATHEVLIHHFDKNKEEHVEEWFPCIVTGMTNGDAHEDFQRVNVQLLNGREFGGCHPDCVREVVA